MTAFLCLSAACGAPRPASDAEPRKAWASDLQFRVRPTSRAERLHIEASFVLHGATRLMADREAAHHFSNFETWARGTWRSLPRGDEGRIVRCDGECRLRYDFELGAAADELRDTKVAVREEQVIISPPSTWLLQPVAHRGTFSYRVDETEQVRFVAGSVLLGERTYGGHSEYAWQAPYAAFGQLEVEELSIQESSVTVAWVQGSVELDRALVLDWIDKSARAVGSYFGGYPVERVLLVVVPRATHRIFGKQLGLGGASILLWVGDDLSASDFAADWIAVHEMVHLAMPSMKNRHLWLNEGLATYVEPVARARAGLLSPQQAWASLHRGMWRGLPGEGDRGFEVTPSWGSTYWGGALYWLLVDIELRKRSNHRDGVQELFHGILRRGGDTTVVWSIERFLDRAEEVTGSDVVRRLYTAMARERHEVDLAELWQQLGIEPDGRSVRFNDDAPLADIRRAITEGVKEPSLAETSFKPTSAEPPRPEQTSFVVR